MLLLLPVKFKLLLTSLDKGVWILAEWVLLLFSVRSQSGVWFRSDLPFPLLDCDGCGFDPRKKAKFLD